MNRKQTTWVLFLALAVALLLTGCGNDQNVEKDPLKPPSVYKNPQVRVTHAPTSEVVSIATVEAEASAFPTDPIVTYFEPTEASPEEIDQAMMDQIDALLSRIENELDRIDTEP